MRDTSGTKRALIIVGATAALVIALLGLWQGSSDTDERPAGLVHAFAKPPTWRTDDRCAFDIDIRTSTTVNADSAAEQTVDSRLRGRLNARVLRSQNGGARVALQLRDVVHETAGLRDVERQALLSVPFIAEFEGGIPARFEFPEGLDSEVAGQLAEFVCIFQATAPDPGATEWSALESHDVGQYRAAYEATADGVWQRSKAAYLPGDSSAGQSEHGVRVISSSANFQPAASASWWQRAQVADQVEVTYRGEPFIRARVQALLIALPDGYDTSSDLAADDDELLRVPVPVADTAQDAATGPASAADRARFQAVLAALRADTDVEFSDVEQLAELMKRFPELAAEIPPLLEDASMPGQIAAGLAHALELGGNTACQAALSEVCSKPIYPRDNRIRAIVALGGVAEANAESVAALWKMSEAQGNPDSQDLEYAALLALGNVGSRLRPQDPERYADLSYGLQATLQVSEPEKKAVVLKAMANAADPELLPVAARELDAPQALVRVAAVSAVHATDQPAALAALHGRLEAEDDAWVQVALIDGMGKLSHTQEATLVACEDRLRTEGNKQVRGALARYLADNLATYPAARASLDALISDPKCDSTTRAYLLKSLHRKRATSRKLIDG